MLLTIGYTVYGARCKYKSTEFNLVLTFFQQILTIYIQTNKNFQKCEAVNNENQTHVHTQFVTNT